MRTPAITEVVLDDSPGHRHVGNMASGYRREAFLSNAADRLVDDELAGAVTSGLALDRPGVGAVRGPHGPSRVVIA